MASGGGSCPARSCGSVLVIDTHSALLGLLTERDLIAKMEEYGIGTDATVADHMSGAATTLVGAA